MCILAKVSGDRCRQRRRPGPRCSAARYALEITQQRTNQANTAKSYEAELGRRRKEVRQAEDRYEKDTDLMRQEVYTLQRELLQDRTKVKALPYALSYN